MPSAACCRLGPATCLSCGYPSWLGRICSFHFRKDRWAVSLPDLPEDSLVTKPEEGRSASYLASRLVVTTEAPSSGAGIAEA